MLKWTLLCTMPIDSHPKEISFLPISEQTVPASLHLEHQAGGNTSPESFFSLSDNSIQLQKTFSPVPPTK